MIDRTLLTAYVELKRRIAAAIAAPESGFQPSMRHASEGLAKHCAVDGELWTYATHPGGYAFTNPGRGFAVMVSETPTRNDAFTAAELVSYIGAFAGRRDLNHLVVDMWLVRAERDGLVQTADGLPGHWRVRG